MRINEYDAKQQCKPWHQFKYINETILNQIDNIEREVKRLRYFKKPVEVTDKGVTEQDIARAKAVPIETLYTGELRHVGGNLVGKCPFHNERTSSFTIFTNSNHFYCFGCNAKHDAIDFVQRRDNCDFITAVKKLINK